LVFCASIFFEKKAKLKNKPKICFIEENVLFLQD
jgi:hypothetical protein